MKCIWNEQIRIGSIITKLPSEHHSYIWTQVLPVNVHVSGYYDRLLHHAVVDLSMTPFYDAAEEPYPWALPSERHTADDHETREAAIRWIIWCASAYESRITIPAADARTDDEVIADAAAERERMAACGYAR